MSNDASNDVKDINEGGRPSKLTDELIEKARLYIDDFRSHGDVIPTIEGLAYYLEIARSTLYTYEEADSRFSDIVNRVRLLQAKMLINGGLMGDFNASITKVMLTKHDYSDKQEIDHKSSENSMKPTVIELVAPKFDNES